MSPTQKNRPTRSLLRFYAALLSGPIGIGPLYAADIFKADNADALNTEASWVGGIVPTAADIAVFDSSVTGSSFAIGGNLSLGGIRVQGNPSSQTINGISTVFLNLGSGGVDLSGATSGTFFEFSSPTIRLAPGAQSYWKAGAGVTSTIWSNIQGLTYPGG
ncbi:MAG: hypothetical protein RLZZ50_1105, partial [Verrucomicrobiota bacterium]